MDESSSGDCYVRNHKIQSQCLVALVCGYLSIGASSCGAVKGNEFTVLPLEKSSAHPTPPPSGEGDDPDPIKFPPGIDPLPTHSILPSPSPSPVRPSPSPLPSPSPSPSKPPNVCFPSDTGGGTVANLKQGISGTLYSLNPAKSNLAVNVDGLLKNADPLAQIFFKDFNVPVTSFDVGFLIGPNKYLRDKSDNILVEWFGFDTQFQAKLQPGVDSAGYYQFAIESDDGSMLFEKGPTGQETVVVANDGLHAPVFQCSHRAIHFGADDLLPMHLKYYQGPRFLIELRLMWRKVADGLQDADSLPCGSINDYQALKPENYVLPTEVKVNPCASPMPASMLGQ